MEADLVVRRETPSRPGPTADCIRPVAWSSPPRQFACRRHDEGGGVALLLSETSCPHPRHRLWRRHRLGSIMPRHDLERPGAVHPDAPWRGRTAGLLAMSIDGFSHRKAAAEQGLCLRLVFHDRRPACGRQRGLRRSVAASTACLLRFSGGRATACADDGTIFSGGDRRGGGGSGRGGGGCFAPGSDSSGRPRAPARRARLLPPPAAQAVPAADAESGVPVYAADVVARFPHDSGAFTEGLLFCGGALYESTGKEGASDIRRVTLDDGKVVARARLSPDLFGEGIACWQKSLASVTWKTGIGFRWALRGADADGQAVPLHGRGLGHDQRRDVDPAVRRHAVCCGGWTRCALPSGGGSR